MTDIVAHPVRRTRTKAIRAFALFLLAPGVVGHSSVVPAQDASAGRSAVIEWADVPLLTADNQVVKLRQEVIQDRLAVINFVYTTCTATCPIQLALFSRLQKQLGDRLDSRVRLVTISLDPATDIPERLKQTAVRYRAKPGWIWLTGTPAAVKTTLRGLGAYAADPTQHPPLMLIGDGRCDRWLRLYGFVAVERIVAELTRMETERGGKSAECR